MIVERITNAEQWDAWVERSERPTFLQSWAWGEFQESLKRNVWRFAFVRQGKTLAIAQCIHMPGRLWQDYIYCPRAPLHVERGVSHEDVMRTFVQFLKDSADFRHALFLRYDPVDAWAHSKAQSGPMMQPWATRVLDLTLSELDLLQKMKPKTRYNIRLSERHKLEVKAHAGHKPLKHFLKLLHETSKRQGITSHPNKYYRHMENVLSKTKHFWIYEAQHEGRTLSSGLFFLFAETFYYLHGASGSDGKNVMAPYALQWQAIRDAKKHGAKTFDFLGVAATRQQQKTWAGITRFKEGFGGRTLFCEHTKEIPLQEKKYRLFRFLKRS